MRPTHQVLGRGMRDDVFIAEVLAKCDVLKRARMWPGEPRMRPRLWLRNFDDEDQVPAAALLDRFTFYSAAHTDALLIASFNALGDGRPKSPFPRRRVDLIAALDSAVFTPVLGENPDPTDSGNFLCRRTRQLVFPTAETVVFDAALEHAYQGKPVVFIDDFVGSGDQFLSTWTRTQNGRSFELAERASGFMPLYVALMSTEYGLGQIKKRAPKVAVSVTHVIGARSTLDGVNAVNASMGLLIEALLTKYASRLTPREDYIAQNGLYRKYGYKERKLLMAFDHSVPDATLPIFWSPGHSTWEPLIERT